MYKKRIFNLISLMINFAIVLVTISSISYAFRPDIVTENALLNYKGFASLKFFTNLSNLYVALTAFVMLVFNVKNAIDDTYKFPKFAVILKFSGTVAVTVTFLTVALFLSPLVMQSGKSYFVLFEGNSFLLHFLTPVLAIISSLFFEGYKDLKFKYTLTGMLPTVIYSIPYTIMVVIVGEENGGWADFYGFTLGGKMYAVPFVMLIMYSVSYLLGVLEWYIQKKMVSKNRLM